MTHSQFVYSSLESSALDSAAYFTNQTLLVKFRSGSLYRYFPVPPAIFHGLIAAQSKGAYFNRHLRDRFPFQRLA